ncbi:MAG: prephenate dehydratase, partial [Craterilacuibacter sp.]
HQLLAPIADSGVSMSKFESRPSRAGLWDYVFFIDLEGHCSETHVAAALEALRARASYVKLLGSYPQAVI